MTPSTTRRALRTQAEADGVPAPVRRRVSSSAGFLGEVLLWAVALIGTVCIVLVILAYSANITLIMFRTGSMAPTIPAGSVAVVQQVSSSEVAIGDVVTVDRPDEDLPVTHRVTSINAGPNEASRIITLRGDANVDDDPFPYTVESVRIVRFSVPGIAPVIVALGNPFVLGGITIAAALLVGWAFWPRSSRVKKRDEDDSPHTGGGGA